mmetsp:Transcript_21494/g.55832  ORF Transcript_21494/g.55832 Transcript_21494/m.55832 type:complete len:84 (-) Transcript_21494:598-849(-)
MTPVAEVSREIKADRVEEPEVAPVDDAKAPKKEVIDELKEPEAEQVEREFSVHMSGSESRASPENEGPQTVTRKIGEIIGEED